MKSFDDFIEQSDGCRYTYQVFGLIIVSGFEIPELLPAGKEKKYKPDVLIQRGIVPESLENPIKNGVRFQAKPGHFLLKMDHIARFYVSHGKSIVVEPAPGASKAEVRLLLLGSVLGALIHQRKQLPLHASAIKNNGKCVIFCGASGYGKSTIARAFIKRGYHLHADEICVIALDNNGLPLVYPGYPALKLWEDTLLKIGEDPSGYSRIRKAIKKFAIPASDQFNIKPLPIEKIYVLLPYNKSEIKISRLSGMNKFKVLKNQTYKPGFVKNMGSQKSHFEISGIVSNHVPISYVYRPLKPFLLTQLSNMLERDFSR